MLYSQVPKHEDIYDELKDLGARFKKTAYNLSAVIGRTIKGFILFAALQFTQMPTVMEPPFNFQFATQGVKIYIAYPQKLFPDM
jgi:hypothetical protein